jgi:hypothetical protein
MKLPFNIPIVSFLGRYWILILLFVGFLFLTFNSALFTATGPLLYAPVLATLALLVTVFLRHIFWSKSLDEDVRTGNFEKWWDEALSPAEKVRWILGVTVAAFIGVCIIIAAVAK